MPIVYPVSGRAISGVDNRPRREAPEGLECRRSRYEKGRAHTSTCVPRKACITCAILLRRAPSRESLEARRDVVDREKHRSEKNGYT